jgi:hypothetical protein
MSSNQFSEELRNQLSEQRSKQMALINFQVQVDTTTDPPTATLDPGIVEDLHPFDRLTFSAVPEDIPVYVNLGDTLVALVKFKGAPNFTANVQSDGEGGYQVIVTLDDGGNFLPSDPP